jgi:hypothetical protein
LPSLPGIYVDTAQPLTLFASATSERQQSLDAAYHEMGALDDDAAAMTGAQAEYADVEVDDTTLHRSGGAAMYEEPMGSPQRKFRERLTTAHAEVALSSAALPSPINHNVRGGANYQNVVHDYAANVGTTTATGGGTFAADDSDAAAAAAAGGYQNVVHDYAAVKVKSTVSLGSFGAEASYELNSVRGAQAGQPLYTANGTSGGAVATAEQPIYQPDSARGNGGPLYVQLPTNGPSQSEAGLAVNPDPYAQVSQFWTASDDGKDGTGSSNGSRGKRGTGSGGRTAVI